MNATGTSDQLIQAIEQADSPGRLIAAVRALSEARLEAGIPVLIRVLGFNNPGAAVTAVAGLVQMGEVAVPALLAQLDGYNYGARSYAIRALAAIADPRALAVLQKAAATDFAPSVRRAATKGLGRLKWSQMLIEQRTPAQLETWQTLQPISQDPDWSLRYAAVVGLEGLAIAALDTQLAMQIKAQLQQIATTDSDRVVQARAHVAQQVCHADHSTAAIASDLAPEQDLP